AGTEVTFRNLDAAPHTVTGESAAWGSTKQLAQGDSLSHTFEEAGVYPYSCILHPGMVGAVVVGGNKLVADEPGETEDGDGDAPWMTDAGVGLLAGVVVSGAAGFALGRR